MGSLNSALGRQRVVDLCDGWIPVETAIHNLPAALADLHKRARRAGRDPASIPISFFCVQAAGRERLERYRALGAVRTVVRAPTAGREEILPFLDRYAEMAQKLA